MPANGYHRVSNGSGNVDASPHSSAAVRALYRFNNQFLAPIMSVVLAFILLLSVFQPSRPDYLGGSGSSGAGSAQIPSFGFTKPLTSRVGRALTTAEQADTTFPAPVCQALFPRFIPQLVDNADAWKARGGIKAAQVTAAVNSCEGGCVHLLIANGGQIFIRSLIHDWQSRTRAMLKLLEEAVSGASWAEKMELEGTELVWSTADKDGFRQNGGDGAGWVLVSGRWDRT